MTTTPTPDPDTDTGDLLGHFDWLGRSHLLYERRPGVLVLDSTTADGRQRPAALFERTDRGLLVAWLASGADLGIADERLLRQGVACRASALAAYLFEAQPLAAALGITPAVMPRPRPNTPGPGASV